MSNKKKVIKITAGGIAALGAIGGAAAGLASCGKEDKQEAKNSNLVSSRGHGTTGRASPSHSHGSATSQNNIDQLKGQNVIDVTSPTLLDKDLGIVLKQLFKNLLNDVFHAKQSAMATLVKEGITADTFTTQALATETSKSVLSSLLNEKITLKFEADHFSLSVKDILNIGLGITSNQNLIEDVINKVQKGSFDIMSFATSFATKLLAGHEEYMTPILGLVSGSSGGISVGGLDGIIPSISVEGDIMAGGLVIKGILNGNEDIVINTSVVKGLLSYDADDEAIVSNQENRNAMSQYFGNIYANILMSYGTFANGSEFNDKEAIAAMLKSASGQNVSESEYLALINITEGSAEYKKTLGQKYYNEIKSGGISALADNIVTTAIYRQATQARIPELEWGKAAVALGSEETEIMAKLAHSFMSHFDSLKTLLGGLFSTPDDKKDSLDKVMNLIGGYIGLLLIPYDENGKVQSGSISTDEMIALMTKAFIKFTNRDDDTGKSMLGYISSATHSAPNSHPLAQVYNEKTPSEVIGFASGMIVGQFDNISELL